MLKSGSFLLDGCDWDNKKVMLKLGKTRNLQVKSDSPVDFVGCG